MHWDDTTGTWLDTETGQPAQVGVTPGAGEFEEVREAGKDIAQQGRDIMGNVPQIQAPGEVQFDPGGPIERVDAPEIGLTRGIAAPDLGAAETVASREVTAPEMGSAAAMDAAVINRGQSDEARGLTMGLAQDLQAAARGEGPSVGDAAFQQKMQEIPRQALGVAAQARGSNRAAARLAAIRDMSEQTRKAAADSAMIKASESLGARGQLGGVLSGVRGQDIGLATGQAGLTQDAAARNIAAINARTEEQARMGLTAATGSADRALEAGKFSAAEANRLRLAEAGLDVDVGKANQADTLRRDISRGEMGLAAGTTNVTAANKRAAEIAAGKLEAGKFNVTTDVDVQGRNIGAKQDAQRIGLGAQTGGAGLGLDATQSKVSSEREKEKEKREDRDRIPGMFGLTGKDVAKGGSAAAVTAISDIRLKDDIEKVPQGAADRLADKLDLYKYRLKGDDRKTVGPMAQDLERDPLGKTFVGEDEDGTKNVDYQGLTMALLASALKGKKERRRSNT